MSAFPGRVVGFDTVDLFGAEQGRTLLQQPGQGRSRVLDVLTRQAEDLCWILGPSIDLGLGIQRRSVCAKANGRGVDFGLCLKGVDGFGRTAATHHEHTRGQRVQRPCVTDLDFFDPSEAAQGVSHLVHHVKRGPGERLVDHHDLTFQECIRLVERQGMGRG